MDILLTQFRYAIKAVHRLSIAVRVALALALAIGASDAVFNLGDLPRMPFVNNDSQVEAAQDPQGIRMDVTPAREGPKKKAV